MKCEEEAAYETNIRQASCMLSVHKDKGSVRLTVPAVLLNPSHCTLAPTGTHVNALCNVPKPSNQKLGNVKAPARHHRTHKTPSFASPHLTGYKQRPGHCELLSDSWSGYLKHTC